MVVVVFFLPAHHQLQKLQQNVSLPVARERLSNLKDCNCKIIVTLVLMTFFWYHFCPGHLYLIEKFIHAIGILSIDILNESVELSYMTSVLVTFF